MTHSNDANGNAESTPERETADPSGTDAQRGLPLSTPPGKIIAVHLNYRSRAEQRGRIPAQPSYFLKPASSLASTGETITRPEGTELLAFEGEVALIIGTEARNVSPEDGWSHVASVSAANDFGLYDFREADKGSNLRSKGGDGFTPIGPHVIDAASIDPENLRVRTWKNGELVQEDSTANLLFPFGRLIADLSQMLTLEPGDIILTGTPAGSSVCEPGDIIEVEVDAPTAEGEPSSGRLVTAVVPGNIPFGDFGSKPSVNDTQRAEAWGNEPEPTLTDALRDKLGRVAVATLSAQLRQRGYNESTIDGVHPAVPGQRIIGTARTLRFIAQRPDLDAARGKGFNAHKQVIDSLKPGEVLVMEARGEPMTGTIGDLLALRAKVLGAAGVVTDGGVRDIEMVQEIGLPTFHQSAHPAVFGRRHIPWEIDATITCGGAAVQPGDIIVGDNDGVAVLPAHLAEELADAALTQERQERFIAEQVAAGESIKGLYPMNDTWRERYAAWDGQ